MNTNMFLYGPTATASPEQPERVSSFISSTYRHLPLMTGSFDTEPDSPTSSMFVPVESSMTSTFTDTLPQPGNCALGGCQDEYSEYTHECTSQTQCGCNQPGCNGGFPATPVTSPRLVSSSTDCTIPGEACKNWLSFHNCYPYLSPQHQQSMCPK